MRRSGGVIALLVLLLSPALADPALLGLVRQDRMVPITLADGSQVRLETMILRPDRSGRFPLVLLFHGTNPASWQAFRAAALGRRMFEAYVASGAPAQLQVLPPYGVDGHAMVPMGPADFWWPAVESFLNQLRLPTSVLVELSPPTPIPAPTPLNAACAGYFDSYVKAWTDAKAYAWNRDGHCSSVTSAQRTVDDAKTEAMRQCVAA